LLQHRVLANALLKKKKAFSAVLNHSYSLLTIYDY